MCLGLLAALSGCASVLYLLSIPADCLIEAHHLPFQIYEDHAEATDPSQDLDGAPHP